MVAFNMKYRICLLITVFFVVISTSGCVAKNNNDNNTDIYKSEQNGDIELFYSQKYLNVASLSADELIADIINISEGNYIDIFYDNEREGVLVKLSETHKKYWVEMYKDMLAELQDDYKKINSLYKIVVNETYDVIDFHYNLDIPVEDEFYYVIHIELICVNLLMLNGVDGDEWKVTINIFNCDNGALVTTGNSDTELKYEESDWIGEGSND